ncbi:Transcription factor [Penicillium occitanis (nom. inval.)]|nr:Transcription factor [Penicillium occitanis (nom. inval.)]PCG92512.1 hypothetical protein PENOC_092150 [Penicillium occitanis (nom. inval.)]
MTSSRNDIPSLMQKWENQTAIPFLRKYVDPDIKSLPEVSDKLSLTENGRGNDEGADDLDFSQFLAQTTPIFPKYSFAGLLFELSSSEFECHFFVLSVIEALELLDITNIPILITVYFEQWQRHSPVLHPSLLDPNTISFPLLLSVILVGAFYSSDEQGVATARMLIPVAEEWVFSSRIFTKQRSSPRVTRKQNSLSFADNLSDLEALQAAFIMIKILLREGDTKKANEIRTTMFDQIIPAARALSLTHVKSPIKNFDILPLDDCKWRKLCLAETQIRLMCGIFNHEASFTVFNNTTPRLLVSELEFDMPCSVHVFDARNHQECSTFILAEARPNLPSPASLIELYLSDQWDDCETVIVPELTILHHFLIVLGLLQKWTMRNVLQDVLSFNRMQTALDRWKIGWDLCTGPLAPEDVERIGFVKHAAIELWYLARKTVDEAATTKS